MAVTKGAKFNPQQYSVTSNAVGELVVTARVAGKEYAQTVAPESYPCGIWWNPTNGNFYAIPLPGAEEDWQFADIIAGSTPAGG